MKQLLFLIALLTAVHSYSQKTPMHSRPNFYLDDWEGKIFTGLPSGSTDLPAIEKAHTVTAKIDFSDTLTKVSKYVFGVNSNNWQGGTSTLYDKEMMRHLGNLGTSALRYPGGNFANEFFFDAVSPMDFPPNVPDSISKKHCDWCDNPKPHPGMLTEGWRLSTELFYALLFELNTNASICVNYSYARYNTAPDRATRVAQAAGYAAEWVRQANVVNKLGIKFWEVGNENMGTWQAGYHDWNNGIISGKEYGEDFCVFVDSMKAVDPTIKIGAITYEVPPEHGFDEAGVMRNWNRTMFPEIKDKADYLVIHSYFTPYGKPCTPQQMLNTVDSIAGFADNVNHEWTTYTGKPVNSIPLAMTEFNTFSTSKVGEKEGASNVSHTSGVFFAHALGEYVRQGYGQAIMWDLVNGYNDGDDHGMFSAHEHDVPNRTPHPSFFHYYFYNKTFGDIMWKHETDNANIRVYPTTFSSGEAGIVLINKSAETETVELDLQNLNAGDNFYLWEVFNEDPSSRKTGINGIFNDIKAGGPSNYDEIPPHKGEVGGGKIKIESKPFSVNYIIIDKKK